MNQKLNTPAWRKWLLTLGLVLGFSGLFAQQAVTGTVTSSVDGTPIEGATVLLKGTTTGTFTDTEGRFSIQVPGGNGTLVISFFGFAKQEIEVAGQSSLSVTLQQDFTLDEVVVTGYGTQKAKEVTSAISSVRSENFNAGVVNDPAQLVQGKVAGLSISRSGSDPNGGFEVRLRGLATFGANSQPLFVIDGVIGASLSTVDPNDIASMDVLKDGSAAAIYGTRAASGVIIVTTKKGIAGTSSINYNFQGSAETIAKRVPMASAAKFVELGGTDLGNNTDWIDQVSRTGLSQVHNLALSGGSKGTSYRASINLRDVNGILDGSGFNQVNSRLNLTQKALNDKLSVSLDLALTDKKANYGNQESFRYANTYNPTAPVFSTDAANAKFGGYFQSENFDYFNPKAIQDQNINIGENKRLIYSIRGNYEIIEGLNANVFYSAQRETNMYGNFNSRESYWRGNAAGLADTKGAASRSTDQSISNLFEANLDYAKDFGKLGIDLLAGYSYQEFNFQGFGASGNGLPSDAYSFNNLGTLTSFRRSPGQGNAYSYQSSYELQAGLARARFDYDDTYYLMASVRYEGSSRFGSAYRYGAFPAVSAGVQLTNLIDVSWIDELKARVGYGVTGAIPGSSYISIPRFGGLGNFLYNGSYIPAQGPISNPNPNLRWEKKGEINAGIDFQFFNYKLNGSIDYYTRITRDLIYGGDIANVPPFIYPGLTANLNNVVLRNNGVEVNVGTKVGSGKFSWEPRILFATYNTVLDTLAGVAADFSFGSNGVIFDSQTSPGAPGLNNLPTVRVAVGEPLGQLWGWQLDRTATLEQNKWVRVDVDEDGNTNKDEGDRTVIGNGLPNFSLSMNNSLSYGDFTFNFFLRGDFGHDILNMYRVFYESIGSDRPIENKYVTDKFININDAQEVNDYYVEKASFLALDNAQLSYRFKIAGYKAGVSLAGQNLFYITGYSGADPNVRYSDPGASDNGGGQSRQFNPSPLAPGLDRRNLYFRTRTFTLGLNITL